MELDHFKLSEFDSPDVPGSWVNMDSTFLKLLDKIREDADIPFKINSAFRTISRNKLDGGKPNSAHLSGHAADISAPTSTEKFKIIYSAIKLGIKRIGIGKTFIHLDNSATLPQNVIWLY